MSSNLEGLLAVLPCAALLERGGTLVARNAAARELLGERIDAHHGMFEAPALREDEVFLGAYPFHRGEARIAGEAGQFECVVMRGDGSLRAVCGACRVIDTDEGPARLITVMERPVVEGAGEGAFVGALLDAAPEAMALTRGGRVVYVNREFTRLFGYENRDSLGQSLDDLLIPEEETLHAAAMYAEVRQGGRATVETVRRCRSGERIDVSLLVGPVAIGGAEPGLLHTFRDIRERRRAEAELEFRALHDVLTGLANRALLQDRLQQGLKRLKREPERAFAVLYLDLDGFKATNDTLGHAAGDELLQRVARALRDCVRPQDTVARVGGDEFALLLESTATAECATMVADRVLQAIRAAAVSAMLPLAASIGIVLVTEPVGTAERMLRQADVAMYHAKAAGKGRSMVYEPGMSMARRGGGAGTVAGGS